LEDEGLVKGESIGAGRTFSITPRGRTWVERHPNLKAPWEAMAAAVPDSHLELANHLRVISTLVHQIAQGGTSQQSEAAAKALRDVRRALVRILAEEDGEE